MAAYYNEIDPYAAQWLRNLIAAGHIAPGDVDERSIEDVHPDDLSPYTQCHFFAGIGVWSLAIRRAGWSDDRPVWTGSCPCQPFSTAGEGLGFYDPRHLWPDWAWLIRERSPAVILGEQVTSKAAGHWVDLVQADMETMGYAFGCVPFPAAGVGAPHIRQRAFWASERMANSKGVRCSWNSGAQTREGERRITQCDGIGRMADGDGDGDGRYQARKCQPAPRDDGAFRNMRTPQGQSASGSLNSLWGSTDWLFCRDGKWRPVEPGTFPLAHGTPARVGRLRAYGNAINVEAATLFIRAYMECR